MPANSSAFFPKSDNDRLSKEDGYFVWGHRMQKAFQYCGLWPVVNGSMPRPSPGSAEEAVWLKMDTAVTALLTQCIKGELVVKIVHLETSCEAWDLFALEYSQIGSGSIMYWFACLTQHMPSGGNVSAHINDYQEAICYLANADFSIPEYVAAAILLSTLPKDPKDPESWDYFIKGVKIDKNTTTLSSVINQILEEKHRSSRPDAQSKSVRAESTLVAREKSARVAGTKFCRNCKCTGHKLQDCWAPGGGKEGQGPKRRPHKKKGWERANVAADGGGDESLNVVLEKCLMACEVTLSAYPLRDVISVPSFPKPPHAEDSVYSAHIMLSTVPIIDSSASSHIFSDHSIFSTYQSSSGNIHGFSDGHSSIMGRGEAQVLAALPSGNLV
jgi:hypothetical protein